MASPVTDRTCRPTTRNSRAAPGRNQIGRKPAGTSASHFPLPLQKSGSGSGKPIKNRAQQPIKERDRSHHGLAARNYAIAQLMLQTGLRVSEVAALQVADITMHERSGSVRVRHGKGLKAREVPLNATVRRALKQHLEERQAPSKDAALFVSSRETAMPVRTIQAVIASLTRRAHLKRVAVSAHTLRHTFALGYLRDNPGKLVELASLLGHDSLDTTATYTRPSRDDLAADLERSHLNVDG